MGRKKEQSAIEKLTELNAELNAKLNQTQTYVTITVLIQVHSV